MADKLKGLFGGGEAEETGHADDKEARRAARREERRKLRDLTDDEHDFVNRYTAGHPAEGFSTEEAVNYLQRVRGEVPPEVLQRAAIASVQNLPSDQRKEFAEMLQRRQQGSGMVTIERSGQATAAAGRGGGGAGQDSLGMDDVLGGLFGSLMGGGGGQAAPQQVPQGGGQMDDMLGGLLGSLLGGPAQAPQSQGSDPFGDLLGSLLGGAPQQQAPQPAPQQRAPEPEQAGGGIGDILGSPLGKAVLGGIAAYAMKEMMGGNKKH
ncbi:MAG: hypothetical protein KC442_11740 [Thermomicrobiales bacterium]|nr:hypothetical protein [Thermomicrobiales bacterium]